MENTTNWVSSLYKQKSESESDNNNNNNSEISNSNSLNVDEIMNEIDFDPSECGHDFTEHNAHPLLGMVLTCGSAVCYAGLNLSVKALMFETSWQEIMMIRMFVTWIATIIWILLQFGRSIPFFGPKDKRFMLSLRAFFLWGAMFCCFWSFEFLPVGDGVTLAMSFPVWVSIISHFVFRNDPINRLDWIGWIFVFSGLAGVLCVAQPTFIFPNASSNDSASLHNGERNIGILIGICSAICAGAQYVIVTYTKEGVHWLQIENLTAFLSVCILMPLGFLGFAIVDYTYTGKFFILWSSLSWWRWLEEIGLGLLGFCALALLTRGSMLDAPARTAICLYLQIPVTYIGQSLITFKLPDYFVFIGIFLVIISVIIPGFRKMKLQQQAKDSESQQQDAQNIESENTPLLKTNNNNNNINSINSYTIKFNNNENN